MVTWILSLFIIALLLGFQKATNYKLQTKYKNWIYPLKMLM